MSGTDRTLPELIESRRDGRSFQVLEDACGGVPSRSRIWQIVKSGIASWPEPHVIRGLAKGLGVSEASVIYAAANSLGFTMQQPSRLAGLLPEAAAGLDDEQVQAVLAVVAAMNARRAS